MAVRGAGVEGTVGAGTGLAQVMTVRAVQFLALVIAGLALVPTGAHLAVLPNKIALPETEYFAVQGIYRGWWILGLLWPAAIVVNVGLAVLVRSQAWPFRFALLAAGCFVLMLAIFLVWTQPANRATQNWTTVPANWEALRLQWEYSHAANAGVVLLAFCLTTLSALSWKS